MWTNILELFMIQLKLDCARNKCKYGQFFRCILLVFGVYFVIFWGVFCHFFGCLLSDSFYCYYRNGHLSPPFVRRINISISQGEKLLTDVRGQYILFLGGVKISFNHVTRKEVTMPFSLKIRRSIIFR